MDKMFDGYVDLEKSTVSYITKGQEMATKFISERLVRENTNTEPEKSFYYTLARSGMHINESHYKGLWLLRTLQSQ